MFSLTNEYCTDNNIINVTKNANLEIMRDFKKAAVNFANKIFPLEIIYSAYLFIFFD